jgi:hypothetical protein
MRRHLYLLARPALCVAAVAALWLCQPTLLHAQPNALKSPEVVKQLVQAMTERKLTIMAVKDPSEQDRYVAVMLFPDVQLLLISARTANQAYIDSQLASGGHAEIYAALHQGIGESKLFVQDMGADGLHQVKGGPTDVVYERGTKETILNGDRKATDLSEADYRKMVTQTDEEYTRLLNLLLEAVKAKPAGGGQG